MQLKHMASFNTYTGLFTYMLAGVSANYPQHPSEYTIRERPSYLTEVYPSVTGS